MDGWLAGWANTRTHAHNPPTHTHVTVCSIVKHLGAKDLVMAKIDDADPEVQRHALQCMSKIMVQQWEFMR